MPNRCKIKKKMVLVRYLSFKSILVFLLYFASFGSTQNLFISENIRQISEGLQNINYKQFISNSETFSRSVKSENNSTEYDDELCNDQLGKILDLIINKNFEPWLIELIDPWGKIPSGILSGHIRELGNFEQCLKYKKVFDKEPELGSFEGQYCTTLVPFDVIKELLESLAPGELPDGPLGKKPLGLSIGICSPSTCSPKILDDFLKSILRLKGIETNLTLIGNSSCVRHEEINFEAIDYVAIVVFSSVALITILSTIYDYVMRSKSETSNELLIAFSIITNGEKLFKVSTINSPHVISCINGIRCLSITWVVFGHSYLMMTSISLINPLDTLQWFEKPYACIIQFGTVSVDTFLFISGLLLVWGSFRQMERNKGKLNIPMMYFHRYIRLTPVVAVTILFCVSLFRHLGSGPFWAQARNDVSGNCETNWWTTLLYLQNYVGLNGNGLKDICLSHTWYLAVDTQLYFLSPLVLIPLWKWGRKAFLPIIFLGCCSMACVFCIFIIYQFSTIKMKYGFQDFQRSTMTYIPTHARCAPWLVGILLGYILFESRDKKCKMNKLTVALGWTISLGTLIAVVFGPYNRSQKDGGIPSDFESAIFESLSRTSWSIGVAWVVYACHKGYGGIVNKLLSLSVWDPLSKLTYSIYILHMILQQFTNGNMKTDLHFSDFEVIRKFWSDYGLTIVIATVAVLTFESPIIGIEKVIFRTNPKKLDKSEKIVTTTPADELDTNLKQISEKQMV